MIFWHENEESKESIKMFLVKECLEAERGRKKESLEFKGNVIFRNKVVRPWSNRSFVMIMKNLKSTYKI